MQVGKEEVPQVLADLEVLSRAEYAASASDTRCVNIAK
jgi:hypothetical protein